MHAAMSIRPRSLLLALCFLGAAAPVRADAPHRSTSLVFVSDDLPDTAALARVLPPHEVVRLSADGDALSQIGRALSTRRGVRALTLVSHGAPGALHLGAERVDRSELDRRAAEIQSWRASLAPGADILLYGCEVGAGPEGRAFLSELSALTGADVAASTDLTGGADDADWILERTVGRISAPAPWSPEVMAAWRHRLITVTEPPDIANTIGSAPVYTLSLGANTVSGSVTTTADGQDNFQVAVPAGAVLSAVSLTLDTSRGFVGFVTFNISDTRMSSGSFTSGLPAASGGGFGTGGAYYVQVVADFAVGNAWSMSFTVVSTSTPVCGNGTVEAGEACDDGNSVACDGCSSSCTTVVNGCSIGGACIAEGTLAPGNPCRACQRSVSRSMYTPVAAGVSCDDGLYCTVATSCNGSGACTGAPRDCGDGLACTTDSCDETANACVHPLTSGCLIGGACVADGALDPSNGCMACAPGSSTSAYSPAAAGSACDDTLFCTVSDACDGAGTCAGAARECGDGSDCTTDSCDESAGACAFEPIAGCMPDGGAETDAGMLTDAGTDAGTDASMELDASVSVDAGTDAGAAVEDASIAPDAALPDAGGASVDPGGCGCRVGRSSGSAASLLVLALLALVVERRGRRKQA